jgi:nucleotide-binding universal stress UspA family protein
LRPEEIVLSCGRPVLVVPYAGAFADIGRRVLIAWNGSREAARALHDAMFLLGGAEAVTVIEIDPPAPGVAAPAATTAQVAAALSRRGIAAKPESDTSGDIGVEDLLLSRASDLGADLLVMGAYGHSRMREFVLGGVSRSIFRHMTMPVLMAH